MTENSLDPILLSIQCGVLASLVNLPWGIFWGWLLARKNFVGKIFLQSFLYTPLVLPPILTGYFLLVLLGKQGFLGQWLDQTLGLRFVLDWKGAVLAASVVSSPFMIQAVKIVLEQIDRRYELVARSLGAGRIKTFFSVILPLSLRGIVSGFFLVFARSIGEFGATIMVAGNIPAKTQTIPLAIYSHVYLQDQGKILPLIISSLFIAYAGLALSAWLTQKRAVDS